MAREWDSIHLVEVLEALARQADSLVLRPLQLVRRWYDRPAAHHRRQRPAWSSAEHRPALRPLNDLFATFLDESMSYSAALFTDEYATLEQAQTHKIERILDVTGVRQGTCLLEIGTGWGELALRAARRGARVTSVTLSNQQACLARKRAAAQRLGDVVDIRVQDYRDVAGTYDSIVSVEMVEAVGERWWPAYFQTLDRCLAAGGRVGLQAITMAHERLLATRSSWTWIHKYIFPGGLFRPSRRCRRPWTPQTPFAVVDRMSFGRDYATTLACWRERFRAGTDEVERLGFDETFRRMWSFYLAYSEAGFRSGYLDVVQLVLARKG